MIGSRMAQSTFVDYALSPNLSEDETYTVELLIERGRQEIEDPVDWIAWGKRNDAREEPEYRPKVEREWVAPAAAELEKLTWLSFQKIRTAKRPVRDITALRYLPDLEGLCLNGSEVSDLRPLRHCVKLERVLLSGTPVMDLSPLEACVELDDLEIGEIPVLDLSVLESLPRLRQLSISSDQVPLLRRVPRLPAVEQLRVSGDCFESFVGFPEMPNLRVIWRAEVCSLEGLEGYLRVENLINFSGPFSSLKPLAHLKNLTHMNCWGCRVSDLKPLAGLLALRELHLDTEAEAVEVSPLESLPSLHDVAIKSRGVEVSGLEKLRSELSSWDVEFLSKNPRYIPSLAVEIVDQAEFDYYDGQAPYGILPDDTNEELLASELGWLDSKIDDVFAVDFEEDEDYAIPLASGGRRSRTVMLYSTVAIDAFSSLVLGIQDVLSRARNDWIIYLQSDPQDGEEDRIFTVWIYPEKIVVTPEYAEVVKALIDPRRN